jgi:hypothetical protein
MRDRIGLWDRSDPALLGIQELSFYFASVLAITASIMSVGFFLIGLPIVLPVVVATFNIFIVFSILLAPILPVTNTLSEQKIGLLAETSLLIEEQQARVLDSFKRHVHGDLEQALNEREQHEHEVAVLKELTTYHGKVSDISHYPSGLRLVYTGFFSIAVAVAPLAIAYVFGGSGGSVIPGGN